MHGEGIRELPLELTPSLRGNACRDAFGYTLSSVNDTNRVHTAVGIGPVAVDGVRQLSANQFEAQVHFTVPAGATAVRVLVGSAAAGQIELPAGGAAFAATLQADDSYSATVTYTAADATFQIEWRDAQGLHRTGASATLQRVQTSREDVSLKATPEATAGAYTLSVGWNLADLLAAGDIAVDTTGPTPVYSVFIGHAVTPGQSPLYLPTPATLVGGVFKADIAHLGNGPRLVYLQYVRPDGSLVNAAPITLATLTALDTRLQNLQFEFGDVGVADPVLSVRTRKTGDATWVDLPAAAIAGFAANLLGLATGGYDYEATLAKGGQTLRKAAGSFTMREPTSIAGLTDAANAGAVAHTIDDAGLVLSSLLPIASNETLVFTLKDAQGNPVVHSFTPTTATLDLAALNPGSYTLHAVKTRTTTTTAGTPPVTTTTATTTADIGATVVVGPLTLTDVQAGTLAGSRSLTAYALDAARNETTAAPPVVSVVTTTTDHTWSLFDGNGLRTYSNENGGVWTRYFHDAQGRVTKEVRFQRSSVGAGGARTFQPGIEDFADRPTAEQLDAEYDAAVAAHSNAPGADHIRTTTRAFDAQGNQLRQTEVSLAHGAVSSRATFDRFNNKTLDVSAAGIAGLENTMRMAYDGMDHVVMSETGPFEHFNEANVKVTSSVAQTYGFDARGNQTTATDARGFTTRMHYDTLGRMTRQWDAQGNGKGSTLRTDHEYDAFDRRTAMVANDLTTIPPFGIAQALGRVTRERTTFDWTSFDQLAGYAAVLTDAVTHRVSRTYDRNGNQTSEQDARGNTQYFTYDKENRVTDRKDRLGSISTTHYNAYGQRMSQTDANGRVTEWHLGAFGQTLEVRTRFGTVTASGLTAVAAYAGLQGAADTTETQLHDWLGRLTKTTDTFGKDVAYQYSDADEQLRVDDLALHKAVAYTYDALGRRTAESLTHNGLEQRHQTNGYNNQGWLASVSADATYEAGNGTLLSQTLNAAYQFDAAGNRVRVRTEGDAPGSAISGTYAYDASGRMTLGRDDKIQAKPTDPADQVITEIAYDGYGNRIREVRKAAANAPATTENYTYDTLNRVLASTDGAKTQTWEYDANGNTTKQKNRDGVRTETTYNAENRARQSYTTGTDGKGTRSTQSFDAVGNIMSTHVVGGIVPAGSYVTTDPDTGVQTTNVYPESSEYGFTETTTRDVRYLEQSKTIGQSWAKGAAGLSGATAFTYDANGNLVALDRGRKQDGSSDGKAFFDYDLEGHIIGRADVAGSLDSATFFTGYLADPDALQLPDGEYGVQRSVTEQVRNDLFGGLDSIGSTLQSYLYANSKSIAEARGSQTATLRKLSLGNGLVESAVETIDLGGDLGTTTQTVGWTLTLAASDIRRTPAPAPSTGPPRRDGSQKRTTTRLPNSAPAPKRKSSPTCSGSFRPMRSSWRAPRSCCTPSS